jgi:hypothetical protein
MEERRPFCAEVSRDTREPLAATASRVDHWILVEYRGQWSRDILGASALSGRVKAHLREQLAALPNSRLLFVRRPDRRGNPALAVFRGRSLEGDAYLSGFEVESYHDLLAVDLTAAPGEPIEHPFFVVCTHGKRDRCCARYGRPLYDQLRAELDERWVWQSTHVGGDRFAGNLVCLPEGLYYGRVGRVEVGTILDDYLARRVTLDHYRGRSCYTFPEQAAELAVRREAGLTGIEDLALAGSARTGRAWRVSFLAGSDEHELDVVEEAGEATYLTCSSPAPQRPRHFVAARRRTRIAR